MDYETDRLKRSVAETSMRICQICLSPIRELKTASYLEKGGLRLVVHDECLTGMVQAITEQEQLQREREALIQSIKQAVKG